MSFTKSSNLRVVDSAISYIRGDKNVTHIGDKYYQDSSRNNSGLATLSSQVAFSALHDSEARYPQPNVLPGTRGGIIETLSRWCEDPFKRNRVYWISGAAGVGKSAIAQALSEKYIQTGQLAASFFFSRNDATRDKLDPFVATIAHQLATSNNLKSLLAPLIDHTIHSSPGSLHKQWETQFTTLIEEPCAQVDPRQWLRLPRLVIIDGVDECIEVKSQKRLLRMIGNSTSTLPLDFLIFSRPEPHISQIFHHESFIPSPSRLALGDFAVWNDIERYFRHEFARIREEHWHKLPSSQASWPGEFVIHQLLCKATGQFIYATTVMKFIDTGKLPVTPGLRLEIILRAGRIVDSSSPYPDLDQLYSQILKLCINEGGKLQKILRLIVSPFEGLNVLKSPFRLRDSPAVGLQSLWALEQLLGLSEGEAAAFLSGLHSILDVPSVRTDNVAVLHASFSEFLLDRHRAGVYYVGEQLSSQEWNQLLVPWQVRTLSRFCIESESWPVHSQDHPINGIHDVDNGSLNVWKYLYDNRTTIAINDEIAAALNAFDPHLYLATLLHWTYELDPLVQRTQPPSSTIRAPIRAPKLGSISLPPRNATVSRQGGKSRDWRHQTLSVHAQISMLYSVFRMLKKLNKPSRRSLQRFFKRCKSLFRGFYVSFPGDQDHESIQYTLLACQLSFPKLYHQLPDSGAVSHIAYLKPILGHLDVSLRVVSLDNDDGRPPTVPAKWEVKYIDPSEGRLFRKLLELLIDDQVWKESEINFGVMDVFATFEIEDWSRKLAQLSWKKTWRTYLIGKLAQTAQGKRVKSRAVVFEREQHGQGTVVPKYSNADVTNPGDSDRYYIDT